jgi:hypothetical protein
MKFFVFRITNTCDKRCATCCCPKSRDTLSPDLFEEKLLKIDEYCRAARVTPLVMLTGGEPFLYKGIGKNGRPHTVVDLADMVKRLLGGAFTVVKTSGWKKHPLLDRRFHQLQLRLGEGAGEVRLGFNLFQHRGAQAEERLSHMIGLLLMHQDTVRIETIYDKENVHHTFAAIEGALRNFDVPRGADLVPPNPEIPYRHIVPVRGDQPRPSSVTANGRRIVLDTMPAHSGVGDVEPDRYYEVKCSGLCARVQSGPDHVMYDPDLSVFHCNDAFADHAVPAFPGALFGSIQEEFLFLERRFAGLSRELTENKVEFRNRREQCTYCTRFFHREESIGGAVRI